MRESLKWGLWFCALTVTACSAGAQDGESGQFGARQSALEPAVGAEIGTDAPALTPTDLGHSPVIASDGSGFLTVQEVNARIRAVRVDADGHVLDQRWLDLGEGSESQYYPSVAFGAGHYLVTWSALDAQSTVRGRFVRPDGTLEGTSAFTLSSGQGLYSSVGWTGSLFLVSWLALDDSSSAVTVAAFDASGAKIADSEHGLSSPGSIAYPRLAVGSRRALVVWEKYTHTDEAGDIGRIDGRLVDLTGTPVNGEEFALSNSPSSETTASVASSGSHFFTVWQTQDDTSRIFGSSIDDNGTFDQEDATVSRSTDTTGQPSITFDGSQYLVAWADGRDQQSIYGTPVSATGVVQGSADVKLATGAPQYVGFGSDRTALGWNGSKFLLSFLGHGIEASLITADLRLAGGAIALTAVPSSQGYPSLAWNGSDYVVLWTDERESSTDMSVRAVRIDPRGQVLDPNSIVLSSVESPAFSAALASAGNGSSLSIWSGVNGTTYWRTLAANGALGTLSRFDDQPLYSSTSVAGNGNGYLAVYMSGDSSDGAIFGRLMDASGSSGTSFRIESSTANTGPRVFAAPGRGYLVSYSNAGTRVISVSATGQVGASVEVSQSVGFVQAATGADKTLLTWTDSNDTQIRARFFASDALSAATLILAESSAGYGATLSWDGSSYFAIWETPEHHLDGRRIDNDGTLGPVSTLVNEECYGPVSASNEQGQLLVSYIKYGEGFRSRRIASRLISAPGGVGGGSGSAGSAGVSSGGASGGGASGGSVSNGGALSTAGSGTGGSVTGGATGSGAGNGGGTPLPVIIKCNVRNVGDAPAASGLVRGFGWLAAGIAVVIARRRRRATDYRSPSRALN